MNKGNSRNPKSCQGCTNPQKGNKANCNNYRTISLTFNLSKILEKIMYDRLYSFLEKKESLYEHLFGFRNNHSTTHALIEINESIRKSCDNGLYSCGIFLDLKKAFNNLNHKILLSKLEYLVWNKGKSNRLVYFFYL